MHITNSAVINRIEISTEVYGTWKNENKIKKCFKSSTMERIYATFVLLDHFLQCYDIVYSMGQSFVSV